MGRKKSGDQRFKRLFLLSLFLLSLLLISSLIVSAKEDFAAVASATVTACACSNYIGTLSLQNTGDVSSFYTLSKAGDAADYVNYVPFATQLDPLQKQNIAYFVAVPCDYKKQYTLQTTITTQFGNQKQFTQTVQPVFCSNLQFVAKNNIQGYRNCGCTPTLYTLKIKNTANYVDIFTFSVDLPKEYYELSERSLVLLPYEEKELLLYVKLPCEFSEAYTFTATAVAQSTQAKQQLPLYLQIDKACYQAAVELGKGVDSFSSEALQNLQKYQVSYSYQPAAGNAYAVCSNRTALLPVKITNPSDITNAYSVHVENQPTWMTLESYDSLFSRSFSFPLYGKQQRFVPLFLQPDAAVVGSFAPTLVTTAVYGDKEYRTPLLITVNQCLQNVSKAAVQTVTSTINKTVTNQTAAQQQTAQKGSALFLLLLLLLFLLLLVALLVYFFMFRKAAAETSVTETTEEVVEEKPLVVAEKRKTKKQLQEEEIKQRVITAEDTAGKEQEKGMAEVAEKEPWYKRLLPLFIVLFLLLFLLLGLFVVKQTSFDDQQNVSKNATKNLTASAPGLQNQSVKNQTPTIVPKPSKNQTPNITQKPLTQQEIALFSFTNRTLYQNEPYFINLSKHFKDKENDTVTYGQLPAVVENISISIKEGLALLQPEKDFLGQRKVIFTATDQKGGKAKTPEITLNVIKRESLLKIRENLPFIITTAVIIVLFVIVLIVVRSRKRDEENTDTAAVVSKRIVRRKRK